MRALRGPRKALACPTGTAETLKESEDTDRQLSEEDMHTAGGHVRHHTELLLLGEDGWLGRRQMVPVAGWPGRR